MAAHRRHINMLADVAINADDLKTAEITLRRLEQVLSRRSPLFGGPGGEGQPR